MKQKLYAHRWPVAILLASIIHALIIFLVGNQWHKNVRVAQLTSAPMVIKLAPLAYNITPLNDISPVLDQTKKRQQYERKKHIEKQPSLDIPKDSQSKKANIAETKKVVDEPNEQDTLDVVAEISSQLIEAEKQQEENSAFDQGHQRSLQDMEMSWQNKVMVHLAQKKRYPRNARKRKQEGTVFVRFDVDKTGHVENIEVIKKSKFSLLNKEAVAVVARSAPLPLPPNDFLANQKKIVIPIKFYLL
jgi:protein TonB